MLFGAKNNLGIIGNQEQAKSVSPDEVSPAESKERSVAAINLLQCNLVYGVLKMYSKFLFKSGKYETKEAVKEAVSKVASAAMDNGDFTAGCMDALLNDLDRCLKFETANSKVDEAIDKLQEHVIENLVVQSDPAIVKTLTEDEQTVISDAVKTWNDFCAAKWAVRDMFGESISKCLCNVFDKYKAVFDPAFVAMFCKI